MSRQLVPEVPIASLTHEQKHGRYTQNQRQIDAEVDKATSLVELQQLPKSVLQLYATAHDIVLPPHKKATVERLARAIFDTRPARIIFGARPARGIFDTRTSVHTPPTELPLSDEKRRSREGEVKRVVQEGKDNHDTYAYQTRFFRSTSSRGSSPSRGPSPSSVHLPSTVGPSVLDQLSPYSLAGALAYLPAIEVDRLRKRTEFLPRIESAYAILRRSCETQLECGLTAGKVLSDALSGPARVVIHEMRAAFEENKRRRPTEEDNKGEESGVVTRRESKGEWMDRVYNIVRSKLSGDAAERFPLNVLQEMACQGVILQLAREYAQYTTEFNQDTMDATVGLEDETDDDDSVVDVDDGVDDDDSAIGPLWGGVAIDSNVITLQIGGLTRGEWRSLFPDSEQINTIVYNKRTHDWRPEDLTARQVAKHATQLNDFLESMAAANKIRHDRKHMISEKLRERLSAFATMVYKMEEDDIDTSGGTFALYLGVQEAVGQEEEENEQQQQQQQSPQDDVRDDGDTIVAVFRYIFSLRVDVRHLDVALPFFTRFTGTLCLASIWYRLTEHWPADYLQGRVSADPPSDLPPLPLVTCDKETRNELFGAANASLSDAFKKGEDITAEEQEDDLFEEAVEYWSRRIRPRSLSRFANQSWIANYFKSRSK